MRRRKIWSKVRANDRETALGQAFHTAVNNLSEYSKREVAGMLTPLDFTNSELIESLWPPAVLDVLARAKHLTEPHTATTVIFLNAVRVNLNWTDTPYLPASIYPEPDTSNPVFQRFSALIEGVVNIHQKYGAALAALTWLNKHCTKGAIRYYWPCAAALCPDVTELTGELPRRFDPPDEPITKMLPLLRDGATTIASALLIPDDVRAHNQYGCKLWLTIPSTDKHVVHDVTISIPEETYHFDTP